MPPVRWKLSAVTIAYFLDVIFYTHAQIGQEQMTADGWRPIIGSRNTNYYESFTPNPNDFYKYEVYSTTPNTITATSVGTGGPSRPPFIGSSKMPFIGSSKSPFISSSKAPFKGSSGPSFRGSPKPQPIPVRKIPHQKPNPYYDLPTHEAHGPLIPLGAVVHTRQGQIGHIKQSGSPATNKPFIQVSPTIKRAVKPVRHQIPTSTSEIFTASATSGYSQYKRGPSNIRTRETLDLGNHYSINQPHTHVDFTNGFALPPNTESVYQQYNPITQFVFDKHPQSNDVNYQYTHEDFTRTLIPPPQVYKNKEPVGTRIKDTHFIGKPNINENIVLQVPPFQYAPQKINEPQVQVQVTKEKLHEFHNNLPDTYHGQYLQYDFTSVRKPATEPPKPVYEDTEPPIQPTSKPKKQRRPQSDKDSVIFLPTPYKPQVPSSIEPTSPTQSEVSTIFTKLSQIQREKESTTPGPFDYNVKEVSTHYPILGKPIFGDMYISQEYSNDITTSHEDIVTTTREPQRIRPHRRRRPEARRTTTTTTTTTEEPIRYNEYREETSESVETERPIRRRRPQRYRTTTPVTSSEETTTKRGRIRYRHRNTEVLKRTRPTTTIMPENHKSEEYNNQQQIESEEAASVRSEEIDDSPTAETSELELPEHYSADIPKINTEEKKEETIKPFIIITTERTPTTNLHIPENEIEVTSISNIEDTTTTTPAPVTTPTPSHIRIKNRPFKFDNSNRPRFSVKDYRQKLSQYSTTVTPRTTSETSKIRLPNRMRRPSSTPSSNIEEDTETIRPKFKPKEPRHTTTEGAIIISENNIKSVNTRLRPFGRYKSTTSTTPTPKISIKPNLFNRKRPPMLSLKNKIHNKNQKNTTEAPMTTTTEENEVKTTTEDVEYESDEQPEVESTSVFTNLKLDTPTEENFDTDSTTSGDFSRIDAAYYSQRVSDLTSSSDYNTPGLFKSVSPTSRRVPNHFTISTDDPILPIEAFFSNIKDKMRDKSSQQTETN